jgi:hypothetical protein
MKSSFNIFHVTILLIFVLVMLIALASTVELAIASSYNQPTLHNHSYQAMDTPA